MSRIFDPENKFWSFIGKIADVTCMSVLWAATSLPLVTLGAMYAGYRLLGVGGMIVFPIAAMLFKQLWDHSGLQPDR